MADEQTKERARDLRRAGFSVAEIARALDLRSRSMIHRWVADIAPATWTRRPNAKDDVRDQARELRAAGASLNEIAKELSVSKSSVSLWVRDLPVPDGLLERAHHAHRMNSKRWLRDRARREAERQEVKAAARQSVGTLSDREVRLLGAVLYWAEGSKDKSYDRREKVILINSDVQIIVIFQRWLDLMAVPDENRRYRLSIHENADVDAAHAFWSDVTGVPVTRFARPTLKHHNPKTVRLNVGDDYHGCFVISVCQSRTLYQQIDGLFHGITAGASCTRPVALPGPSAEPSNLSGPSAMG